MVIHPIISAVVAVDEQGAIGKNNAIPWHLPADLRHFKNITFGHPIIMGRRTYESIGKPLPGRLNIVITRNKNMQLPGVILAGSIDEALKLAGDSKEIFVIGGEEIFRLAMPLINQLYLTKVHADASGDRFFRYEPSDWTEIDRQEHKADDKNPYDYDFLLLKRA